MRTDTIVFDIETIPMQDKMSEQQLMLLKKMFNTAKKRQYPDGYTFKEARELRNMLMGTSPFLGEIVTIGVYRITTKGTIQERALMGTEKEILESFWKGIETFKGLFVSFNGLGFDVSFILKRSMKHGIAPTNNSFLDVRRYSRFPHFDIKLVIGDYDRYAPGTLDLLTTFLGVETPKSGKIHASQVFAAYKAKNIKGIADYCLKDVKATFEVYEIVKKYIHNPKRY